MLPVVTIDLGATHLRVAIANDKGLGPVVVRRTADLAPTGDAGIVPALCRAVREAVTAASGPGHRNGAELQIGAVGIGLAGFIDPHDRLIDATPYGVPAGAVLRESLEREFGVPVVVDNDAKMAALGELERGAARATPDFVLVTLGTNIGGAVVEGGRVRRGAHGIAGEVGMLLVPARRAETSAASIVRGDAWTATGTPSAAPHGYAYLEDLAGGRSLVRQARAAAGAGAAPEPSGNGAPSEVSPDVFAAASDGDEAARAAVDAVIEGWAVLVADLSFVLDPGLVVLSGGLVSEAHHFLDPLRRRVSELTAFAPEIRIGELGASAGLVGAAVAARRVIGTPEARQPDGASMPTGDMEKGAWR
jgi:glucokinase